MDWMTRGFFSQSVVDFSPLSRPIAVGALVTTMTACSLTIAQIRIDVTSGNVHTISCPNVNRSLSEPFEPTFTPVRSPSIITVSMLMMSN